MVSLGFGNKFKSVELIWDRAERVHLKKNLDFLSVPQSGAFFSSNYNGESSVQK